MRGKITFLIMFLCCIHLGYSQSVNLTDALISPAPLPSVQANGSGTAEFRLQETSGSPVSSPVFGSLPNVTITVDLGDFIDLPNGVVSLSDITIEDSFDGTDMSGLFTMTYDGTSSILKFEQTNNNIPADANIKFTFPVKVVQNSSESEVSNGFNANIAALGSDTNAEGNAAFFTWTTNTTTAVNDISNTYEGVAVSGNVSTNDFDLEGDTQTVSTSPVTNVSNGTLTLNADGSYTYTPNAGFTGEDSFTYEVCDDVSPSACDEATVFIEVLPNGSVANEAPIANADTVLTEEGTTVTGNVASNDFDPDGDPLTVNTTPTTDVSNGTLTLNTDGTFTYVPDAGFTGTDTFTYEVCDDASPTPLCDTATVEINVNPDTGNITVANDDAFTTTPGVTLTGGNVLANDSDPEGDAQTVNTTPTTNVSNGTLTLNADGTFTYVPNAGFTGTDSFTYEVCDDGTPQACDEATVALTVGGIANTTIAENDINNTYVDNAVAGNVLTNDYDLEGDTQTVNTTPVSNVSNGTLTLNADGSYTYTPNAGFTGEDSFTYQVCDDGNPQACDEGQVFIEVIPEGTAGNENPIANADTVTTEEGATVTGNVASNDFDPDGDPLTVNTTPVTDVTNGTLTLNPDGSFTYVPDAGFTGTDSFTYEVCDDASPTPSCDTATVEIHVNEDTGNITVANDDAFNTTPGATLTGGNVLANDSDPEGDTQTVNTTPLVDASNGTLTLNTDGTFTYVPDAGFTGTDTFTYQVCDNGTPQACDEATAVVTVGGLANTTIAVNDISNTYADTAVAGNVLTNDYDLEGDTQSVNTTPVSNVSNGTLTLNADGSYSYTPNAGFTGQDSFTYQVCDDGNPQACDEGVVFIEVIPNGTVDNENPIANADTVTTEEGTTVTGNVASNDFDPDGDPLTVNTTPVTDVTNGTLTLNPDGTFTYVPDAGFTGTDSFTYEVCDDASPTPSCDTATVEIHVNEDSGNITVANDDAFNTTPGTTLTGGNVLANDSDPEGDDQTVNTTPVADVANGTLTLNADGTFTYVPDAGFTGTDSFTYQVCDDGTPQACDEATVMVTVGGLANTTVAVNDISNTYEDVATSGNVLTNDYDPEGDTQSVNTTPVSNVSNGTLTLNADGSYTYTPNAGFTGEDSFTYQVCDDGNPQACDEGQVFIEVLDSGTAANEAPIANADTATTEEGTTLTGNVVSNDFDPDGDPLTVNTTPVTDVTNGTLTLNADGTFTYVPDAGFTGTDSFTYQVCDNATPTAACDTAVVEIMVIEDSGNTTVANDDAFTTRTDVTLTGGNVLTNDSDPEGDTQTVNTTPISNVSNGTLTLNANGTFTYVPNAGFTGTDSFTYQVCDNGTPQACDEGTVVLTVGGLANSTIAVNDIGNTNEGTTLAGNVLTNDSDPEGDTQTVNTTPVSNVSNGILTLNADGSYTYTPNAGFTGEDSFTYQVCDDGVPQACDTAEVFIEVLPDSTSSNNAPIANPDTVTTEEGTTVTGNVASNDFDPDGDDLTVNTTPVSDVSNGTLTLNADGTFTYVPDAGFTGTDSFTYQICDNGTPQACDTATVEIQVNEDSGNITVANDDAFDTVADTANNNITENVLANDSDPEGDTQTVNTTPVNNVSNGTLTLNADGTFNYQPNAGFTGQDSFTYQVCDDGTPQACDTATVILLVKKFMEPDYTVSVITRETNVVGAEGDIDFVVFVGEGNGFNSNGLDTVEFRISDSTNFEFTYDDTLTTLNGQTLFNSDWSYELDRGLHKFTYIGNGGIFNGNTFSRIGIKAKFISPANSRGERPLKATIRGNSGGQVFRGNDNDSDTISYSNNQ
ncbi:VCBS repeat-containing protein [Tenacibaculum sp. MAR_2009_124]|uniref:Ig-like domain-containing protein n=1 Tax=Tenacibaculum sp. MAR_2009_124 TaxID=1250059 RepID=UPI00089C2745|nr:Ig-like domain-containing protein [Tenacibaculum sp. MAR_2009_124]SEC55837.1 VCBS repeat-containing protein [Tenacibaculum sp. MAR_2009_124]